MTKTPRVHWWISLAMLAAGGFMALAFVQSGRPLPAILRPPEDAGVLRLAYVQDLLPDPHRRTFPFPTHNHFILSLWEPLVECDPATGQPQPAAAQSWEWSADRKELTMKLRPDARWSNGDPVTAGDFVRSWRRLLRRSMDVAQTLFPIRNAEAYHRNQLADLRTVGIQAMDDLTLLLQLDQVRSSFVAELADPLLAPLHQNCEATLDGSAYFGEPSSLVTNGAFQLQEATSDGFRLKTNEYYHGRGEVRLVGVHFIRVDRTVIAQRLVAAGMVDMLAPTPYGAEGRLPTARQIKYETELVLGVNALNFNVTRGPLRDVRVRRALALALNRAVVIDQYSSGQMVPAWSWIPSMPGRPGLTLLKEDADEARELLAAAGYPAGKGFPVLELLLPSMAWQRDPYPAEWTECWFQELGVRTHISYESQTARSKRLAGAADYDVTYGSLVATVPDPGDMLSGFLWPMEFSETKWINPEMVGLLNAANAKSGEERLALLERAERLLMTEIPAVPTMFVRRQTMLGAEVHGWYEDPLARQSLKRLWLEQAPVPRPATEARL